MCVCVCVWGGGGAERFSDLGEPAVRITKTNDNNVCKWMRSVPETFHAGPKQLKVLITVSNHSNLDGPYNYVLMLVM